MSFGEDIKREMGQTIDRAKEICALSKDCKESHHGDCPEYSKFLTIADYIESELKKARCDTAREIMTRLGSFRMMLIKLAKKLSNKTKAVKRE